MKRSTKVIHLIGAVACSVMLLAGCNTPAEKANLDAKFKTLSNKALPAVAENRTYLGRGWWTFTIQDTCFLYGMGSSSQHDSRRREGSLTQITDIQFCFNQQSPMEKLNVPTSY